MWEKIKNFFRWPFVQYHNWQDKGRAWEEVFDEKGHRKGFQRQIYTPKE